MDTNSSNRYILIVTVTSLVTIVTNKNFQKSACNEEKEKAQPSHFFGGGGGRNENDVTVTILMGQVKRTMNPLQYFIWSVMAVTFSA
jgi:hypothetical protein